MRYLIFSDSKRDSKAVKEFLDLARTIPRDKTLYLSDKVMNLDSKSKYQPLDHLVTGDLVAFSRKPSTTFDEIKTQIQDLCTKYPDYRALFIPGNFLIGVYSYKSKDDSLTFDKIRNKQLDTSLVSVVNPGFINNNDKSFSIFNSNNQKVSIYTLEEFKEINDNLHLMSFFGEDIISELKNKPIGRFSDWHYEKLEKLNKNRKLDKIIEQMKKFNPPTKESDEYCFSYIFQLASEFQKFVSPDIQDIFDIEPNKDLIYPIDYWLFYVQRGQE